MSKEQARLLRFAIRYRGWHSYGADCRRVILALANHGLIELNEHRQFRLRQTWGE